MAAAASGGAGEWWDVCAKKLMDVGYLLTRMENFGVAEIKSIKPRKKHEGSAAPTLVEQLAHPDADPSVVAAVPSRFSQCVKNLGIWAAAFARFANLPLGEKKWRRRARR